jgi:hypothetical protein
VFGLSCYLLLSDRIKNFTPEDWPNKKTPFFLAHGEDDEVVKFPYGQRSAEMVKELGLEDVTFKTYPYVCLHLDLIENCANLFVIAVLVIPRTRTRLMTSKSFCTR